MCNWFQNKSPTHTFAVDWDTWHGNWVAPCYFNGAAPTGSHRWDNCLQRHLACEGLYDTSRHIGDKNWIQQVLVGLLSSFPINYTCYHYTSVGKYCNLCVQTVEWCQLAWGTMETRFVYFLIVKWTLHSACFTSRAMIQIHILGARLMSFKKIKQISMSYWE